MILAIDVGNTTTCLGILDDLNPVRSWRISTTANRTPDELSLILSSLLSKGDVEKSDVSAVSIGSVVPEADPHLAEVIASMFGFAPFFLTAQTVSGLALACDRPEEVGADRIANALAALELCGCPSIVVDFGTATTFDVISENGEYLGGVIAPGISISSEQLSSRTAKLPMVTIDVPEHVIGRNTIESIRSGLFFGTLGSVNEILSGIRSELGGKGEIIFTGGYAPLIATRMSPVPAIDLELTLKGLVLAVERDET
jgi:type III pantothenate kinase